MRGLLSDRFLKRILGNRKRQGKHSDAALDERSREIDIKTGKRRQPVEGELATPNVEAADNSSDGAEPGQPAGSSEDQQAENDSHGPGK